MKNEALLVSRAALLGDRKAFGRLVEYYQSPVRRFLFNLTGGDEELSKDLSQEAFIKAWLAIGSFRSLSGFSTWLYRITYNTFYDNMRSGKKTDTIDHANTGNLAAKTPDKELFLDIERALSTVSEDEKSALLLFYMEDQAVEKIAKIMGRPTGTVKSYLSRGRAKMADFFAETNYEL